MDINKTTGVKYWLMNQKGRRTLITAYAFLAPAIIILCVFFFQPMIKAFIYSFQDYSLLDESGTWAGLKNFKNLMHDKVFIKSTLNTLLYLTVVPVIAILSFLMAVVVDQKLRGINFFRVAYYLPVVTSMIVVGIVWKQLMLSDESGYLNYLLMKFHIIDKPIYWLTSTKWALPSVMFVTIWKGLGYYMVIFLAGLKTIKKDVIEAAIIDGASSWQRVFLIKMPLLKPTFYLVMIVSSISALKVFEEIFVMTNGNPAHSTSTIVFRIFKVWKGSDYDMGMTSAMGVVLFLITLMFAILSTQYMLRSAKNK